MPAGFLMTVDRNRQGGEMEAGRTAVRTESSGTIAPIAPDVHPTLY